MKPTGREEEKGFFENDLYEVQCKYCGHLEWKTKSSGGHGGGGGNGGG